MGVPPLDVLSQKNKGPRFRPGPFFEIANRFPCGTARALQAVQHPYGSHLTFQSWTSPRRAIAAPRKRPPILPRQAALNVALLCRALAAVHCQAVLCHALPRHVLSRYHSIRVKCLLDKPDCKYVRAVINYNKTSFGSGLRERARFPADIAGKHEPAAVGKCSRDRPAFDLLDRDSVQR